MAVAYDIKAIPTVYGARQFRSRLEAKWASFFDLCGWQFEYEPFDLGEWSPDFLLLGDTKVLVEVKPITALDQETAEKMNRAATASQWDGELLLVGIAPLFAMDSGPYDSPAIGWLGQLWPEDPQYNIKRHWNVERASACIAPEGFPDFAHETGSYTGRIYGAHYKANQWPNNPDWLKRVWDRAANRVQWHKNKSAVP